VLEAAGWGLVGGSALLIGAIIAITVRVPGWVVGLILAFGAGTLVSALTFELTHDAFKEGGADAVAIGLALGALAFFAGDLLIDRRGGKMRLSQTGEQSEGSPQALLLGAILDGIPESAVIGLTLLSGKGIGVPVVAAVFISNFPEGLSSSTGLRTAGWPRARILLVWVAVALVCAVSAAAGYGLLDGASGNATGLINAFAAGAVLTMLTDSMFPEAIKHGGKAAGLVTVLGFAVAFLLATLD
jgi:ZIP family zinc transporter